MKVLQLIDSLQAGGAEKMAVNIANGLTSKISNTYLCATRQEGLLKEGLDNKVTYLFLNKKHSLDVFAIKKLHHFITKNKIQVIHAHSTSFFFATIMKWLHPMLKIVWHDHYGNSNYLSNRKSNVLRFCSKYMTHIFCVNDALKSWNENNLKCKEVSFIPNFAVQDKIEAKTNLKGNSNKRIIHLANLRSQKDHETLFKALVGVIEVFPDWTLHCVGMDFKDTYSENIRILTSELKIEKSVFFYGSKEDITNILNQCDIGVLSSKSEGLPIALLEYGLAALPVVVTNVGDCKKVVKSHENGLLVNKEHPEELMSAIITLIKDEEKAKILGEQLYSTVTKGFSEKAYIEELLAVYNN